MKKHDRHYHFVISYNQMQWVCDIYGEDCDIPPQLELQIRDIVVKMLGDYDAQQDWIEQMRYALHRVSMVSDLSLAQLAKKALDGDLNLYEDEKV